MFTLDEANALVPKIAAVLLRTTQMLGRLRASTRKLSAASGLRSQDDLPNEAALAGRPELLQELAVARGLADAIADEVRALEAMGIVVRDVSSGLVDFRSVLDGEREVFLCWKLGEREIRFYHDVSAGFPGRQSVEGHRFFRSRQLRAPSE